MINWKNSSGTLPIKQENENMTDRLIMWVVFKDEDMQDGRACFGAFNFIDGKFFAVENDIYKRLTTGKATITHWDYIGCPID